MVEFAVPVQQQNINHTPLESKRRVEAEDVYEKVRKRVFESESKERD